MAELLTERRQDALFVVDADDVFLQFGHARISHRGQGDA
jgi:hypothetical protein